MRHSRHRPASVAAIQFRQRDGDKPDNVSMITVVMLSNLFSSRNDADGASRRVLTYRRNISVNRRLLDVNRYDGCNVDVLT